MEQRTQAKLKLKIIQALDNVFESFCETDDDACHLGWIHDELTSQMADAALLVLIACKDSQDWVEINT